MVRVCLLAVAVTVCVASPGWAQSPGDRRDAGLILETGDVNRDGTPDVWSYYRERPHPDRPEETRRVLVRREADLNFNGRKDLIRHYDEAGNLVREEADLDFNGHVDLIVTYQQGKPREKSYFRDASRVVFIRKGYDDQGRLISYERDDNLDGKVNYCEIWFSGERISQIGRDTTGDGRCDHWTDPE